MTGDRYDPSGHMTLLLKSFPARAAVWKRVFDAEGEAILTDPSATFDPAEVTVLACWVPPSDLSVYPNLRMVLSVGAGVDQMPDLPPNIMLGRTLAPGLNAAVRDWLVMATLLLHRDIPSYVSQKNARLWQKRPVARTRQRRVGVMGLGRIGRLAATTLAGLDFEVMGWSRNARQIKGITTFSKDDLHDMLCQSDILICVLPLTPDTRGILNAELFAHLPKGASLVHAGRGEHLVLDDLKNALENGALRSAMLDVTDPEPLPADHWLWADDRILLTPHVAAETDAEEGARHALAVLSALKSGLPIPGLVDLDKGY
ncbi:MAG: glyoxylate/hydroxypyruvate reductase A [Pseudomonadota bacterium]